MNNFEYRKKLILSRYEELVTRKNTAIEGNGIFERYENPVITDEMVPPFCKYDFNPATNPFLMERIGVNATLNSG
ncbi:MAG: glycosidase, partial [Muribaculaceae bacterium]|nr:glycosidase [Muribaculaceae bacterium]